MVVCEAHVHKLLTLVVVCETHVHKLLTLVVVCEAHVHKGLGWREVISVSTICEQNREVLHEAVVGSVGHAPAAALAVDATSEPQPATLALQENTNNAYI